MGVRAFARENFMRRTLTVCLICMVLPAALAQTGQRAPAPLKWGLDFEKSVQEAKKTRFPLMVWIVGRSGDRPEDTERDQKRAFQDALVVELAKRYIPVQMSRSRYREFLAKWGLGESANLDIVFVTPDGDRIDAISPNGAANASSLAQKMALVFRKYRGDMFEKELKPILEKEDAKPAEIKSALNTIDKFLILNADQSVIKLLSRGRLPKGIADDALGTLAVLSTKAAGAELFTRAQSDEKTMALLGKCTPTVAEDLVQYLTPDDHKKMILAYEAIGKICRIRDLKKDKFWDGKNEKLKKDELERVAKIAQRKAQEWRERYEEYR